MKKLLIVLGLILSVALTAQTRHYVAATGGSNANNGLTTGTAWATLAYAVTQVSSPDTIYMLSGTHTIATALDLPVGVHLRGVDSTSTIIYSTITDDYSYTVNLYSGTQGTNGNQTVSNLKFLGTGNNSASGEGDLQGFIYVANRNNVKIFNCYFQNSDDMAVTVVGDPDATEGGNDADHWSTGIEVYNNTFDNCSKRQSPPYGWSTGALQVGSTDGCLIHNNTFLNIKRAVNNEGYCIKYYAAGFNKYIKIYDNLIHKAPSGSYDYDWNFAIELWYWLEGCEIYNNRIYGGIDVDHCEPGTYDYSASIHDNVFGYDTPPTSSTYFNHNNCVWIEFSCNGVEVYNNYVKNMESFMQFSPRDGDVIRNLFVHHNVINGITDLGSDYDDYVTMFTGQGSWSMINFRFENNTVYTNNGNASYGFLINNAATYQSVYVRNNIFYGWDVHPISIEMGTFDTLYIQNNVYYSNGLNAPSVGITPTHYINNGAITSNPLFTSAPTDFTLQSGSSARDAGLNLGYTEDYRGYTVPYNTIPDIGAYEYGSSPADPGTATDITAFTISGQTGGSTINTVNHTVTLTMPYGTNVTNLTPSISLSAGATIAPTSGTARNFTSAVNYTVTAEDGITEQVWTVTVNVAAQPPGHSGNSIRGKYQGKFGKYNGQWVTY